MTKYALIAVIYEKEVRICKGSGDMVKDLNSKYNN